ncbi:MAG: dihydroneopterin aldolase [Bacteroidales bacterium]|nr:dihydroneopterin aldolase [Bacteroidales bacterium]
MGKIELCGMKFFARHGCLEQERLYGGEFLVDFSCSIDTSAAETSDELADTVDYGRIYEIIERQIRTPSRLLEHVAGRIADSISAEGLPGLEHFEVRVSKKNPPVGGVCEWARVSVKR